MSDIIKYEDVESRIFTIRNQQVIVDRDVAELYGVETKEINQAVKNNPDKFPDGYIFELNSDEVSVLRSKILTANVSPKTRVLPKAFTEKGLYMLATILKSPVATMTTIAIVETFARLKEFNKIVTNLPKVKDRALQTAQLEKGRDLLIGLVSVIDDVEITSDETSVELNFGIAKVKRTVKREKRKDKN